MAGEERERFEYAPETRSRSEGTKEQSREWPREWQRRSLVSRAQNRRLDIPRTPRRQLVRFEVDPELFGRFSEKFARFMGTARFIAYMTVVIICWIAWNALAPAGWRFDSYPFIFLTLMLSLQASYAAPLILLAQNRQEARDRVQMDRDRDVNARTRADMEFLAREVASLRMAVGEIATRDYLRSEIRGLEERLGERVSVAVGDRESAPGTTPDPEGRPRSERGADRA